MHRKDSIVFFGTGPVALASLSVLADHFPIEAVVTKPGHLNHSGALIEQSLKLWADRNGIPCYQPPGRRELNELWKKQSFTSRVGLVVDYGILIPQKVISSFELGIVNSHFSLLPQYRGADPITAAILDGKTTTGVSLMIIVPKLDEGPLLAQKTYAIPKTINIHQLTKNLIATSNQLIIETLPKYLSGDIAPHTQPGKPASYTRKLTKSDGIIDWNKPATQIEREIRAYLGWPGSRTQIGGKDVLITKAYAIPTVPVNKSTGNPARPGYVETVVKTGNIGVATSSGELWIEKLKPAGKKEMSAAEFTRGYLRLGQP